MVRAMEQLVALLRCPACGGRIELRGQSVCASGHRYPIVEGIPVLLDEAALSTDPQYASQRAYFDAEFERYEHYRLENWQAAYIERLRKAAVLEGTTPLIDVGVGGSGYTVIEAARTGRPAVGCDLSLRGLLAAREFARSENVAERTLWVCCSAERLPFEQDAFGSALAVAVLEHVPDDGAALAELARVLQRGGGAWVTVPHALRYISPLLRGANRRHDRRLGHLRRYEADLLIERAQTVGLEPVDVQFTGHPVKVVQLLAPRLGDRVWWWSEARDRRRSRERRGSMQLSVLFERA